MDFVDDSLGNGPEFTRKALDALRMRTGSTGVHPAREADGEVLHRKRQGEVPRERLDAHLFTSLAKARKIIEIWRRDNNVLRPLARLPV